jgi:hypothetical protein
LQKLSPKHGTFGINGAFFFYFLHTIPLLDFCQIWYTFKQKEKFKYENIKLKKKMSSGSCLTSKLYDKIIKMPSKSHETIPLTWGTVTKLHWMIRLHWKMGSVQLRLRYIYKKLFRPLPIFSTCAGTVAFVHATFLC